MRRGGAFSLIAYILYTLFWVAMTALLHFGILTQEDAWQLGTALVLVGFFEAYTIFMAVGSLLLILLKTLHMKKGWVICGIICLLVDIDVTWTFGASLIAAGGFNPVFFVLLPCFLLGLGSLIANIMSLKD